MIVNYRRSFVMLLAVSLVGGLAIESAAAPRGKPERYRAHGTVNAIRPGLIQIIDKGKPVVVKVEATPDNIRYTGTAKPSWLRPGFWVQIDAQFNKNLEAQKPLREFRAVMPGGAIRPGVMSNNIGFNSGPQGGAAAAFPAAGSGENAGEATRQLTVTGVIRGIRDGKIFVQAGRLTATAEVDPKATIRIEIPSYVLAKKGDKIEVRGKVVAPGYATANEIRITATKPLEGTTKFEKPKEKPAKKTEPKKEPAKTKPEKKPLDPADAFSDKKPTAKKPAAKKPAPKKPEAKKPAKELDPKDAFPDAKK